MEAPLAIINGWLETLIRRGSIVLIYAKIRDSKDQGLNYISDLTSALLVPKLELSQTNALDSLSKKLKILPNHAKNGK